MGDHRGRDGHKERTGAAAGGMDTESPGRIRRNGRADLPEKQHSTILARYIGAKDPAGHTPGINQVDNVDK